jgi:hypothetical protein
VTRVCFFKSDKDVVPEEGNGDFLGYCVIKEDFYGGVKDCSI